jgi:two-component system nitrogen regulation response regulator NtrX
MAERGTFREDLLYRLAEVVVRLPPLREHKEDVPLLVQRILQQIEGKGRIVSPDALTYLSAQWWPGNVRELRNIVRRAAALSSTSILERELFVSLDQVRPSTVPPAAPQLGDSAFFSEHLPLREARRAVEREYLIRLIARFGTDLDAASQHAGVHRKSLARLIRQHGLGRAASEPPRG